MPGFLLHAGALVQCAHQGTAMPMLRNPRVRVSKQNIVTQPCLYSVSNCTLQPPPVANGPCVTAQWLTASLRVKASGLPVLLADSQSLCVPTGTPLKIGMTQMRVKGQ